MTFMQLRTTALLLIMMSVAVVTLAQENCDAIVQTAIDTAAENCDGLRRNEACYGNVTIDAEAAPDVDEFVFEAAGDIVNVSDVASMRLSSNLGNGDWGISLMQLRASLPDAIPENVTVVLFGNVTTENAVTSDTLEVVTNSRTRIRRTPDSSTDLNIIDAIDAGTTMTAYGRSQSGDWLRVRWNGVQAWIGAITVDGDSERMSLPEVEFTAPFMGPMQSFYLSSDDAPSSDCTDIPPDGILIQTPEGAGTIDFMINEVRVSIGSTAFITVADSTLTVALLEGAGTVGAENAEQFVPAGTQTTVPLTDDGRNPAGEPTDVTYYDVSRISQLTELLDLTPETVMIEPIDESIPVDEFVAEARAGITPRSGQWLLTVDRILTVEDTLLSSSYAVSACALNVQVGFSRTSELSYDEASNTFDGEPMIAPGTYGATPADHSATLAPNSDIQVSIWTRTYTFNSDTSFTWRISNRNNWEGDGPYRSACIYYWRGTYVGE